MGMNGEVSGARERNEARELKPLRREYKLASGRAPALVRPDPAVLAVDFAGSRMLCVRTDGRRARGWPGFCIATTFKEGSMPTRGRDQPPVLRPAA